jgi:cytochrome c peroxidase
VWTQAGTLRQTPMLAERLADTAPYNWQGTSRTLDENIHQTITERLEGDGLSKADTAALRRYLLEGLRPVKTRPTPAEALVARGAELFADEEVGCAHCHPAERGFTDGKGHDVKFVTERERERFQLETGARRVPKKFDTPSLRHLKVTAPYLHNGEAATLAMLLEVNHDRMGATSQLSPDEREALVAYLESL